MDNGNAGPRGLPEDAWGKAVQDPQPGDSINVDIDVSRELPGGGRVVIRMHRRLELHPHDVVLPLPQFKAVMAAVLQAEAQAHGVPPQSPPPESIAP